MWYFFENIVRRYVWQIITTRSDFLTQNAQKALGTTEKSYSAPSTEFKGTALWQGRGMEGTNGLNL